jgi:hypothetical protein
MGIEYIARERLIVLNHRVATADGCRVRFLCEKHRHTNQRQPMRRFGRTPRGPPRESEWSSMTRSCLCRKTAIAQVIRRVPITAGATNGCAQKDWSVGLSLASDQSDSSCPDTNRG